MRKLRLCLVHNLLSFKRELKKMMLFKIFSRPIGMDKFKGTYPVRRVCEDAAIVGIFEFFGSDLSPDKEYVIGLRKGCAEDEQKKKAPVKKLRSP
ncbi:hypothetical protein S83_036339 [Arachis hypogaea]|uniref:Uncharacterized protein n=1 Tax=Arachis hypogaea TaxID=3818 RepID=A0A445AYC6_ARAHY|nr:hypothetical protein Ahy_B01g056225 isoform K [Arachis hypogaea]